MTNIGKDTSNDLVDVLIDDLDVEEHVSSLVNEVENRTDEFRFKRIKDHVTEKSVVQHTPDLTYYSVNRSMSSKRIREEENRRDELRTRGEGEGGGGQIEINEECVDNSMNMPSPMTKKAGYRNQRACKQKIILANSPSYKNYV